MSNQRFRATPEQIEEAHRRMDEYRARPPQAPIGDAEIDAALDYPNQEDYFITTNRYWDCDCDQDYIRPVEQVECRKCGAEGEDQPDSRINEIAALGIALDLQDPAVRETLEEHGPRLAASR